MKLPDRILVLSAHTDDGELGAGGTIAKQVERGGEAFYVAFSAAEKSLPRGMPRNTLREECLKANQILGLPSGNVRILHFEVRTFPLVRQDILEKLVEIRDELKPDLVLTPSSNDVHQDHRVLHEESIRAFKTDSSIWGYEHPWNDLTFTVDVLVSLTKSQADKKISALGCYKSQMRHGYFDPQYMRALLRVRGTQAKLESAEAFESVRVLIS